MTIKRGMDAVLNFKTGGVGGGGSWNELANVKDVTLSLETGEADITTRANAGWRATVGTLKEASVEFEMIWDTADAGFTAIKDAFFNNAVLGLRARSGLLDHQLQPKRAARRSDHRVDHRQGHLRRHRADLDLNGWI